MRGLANNEGDKAGVNFALLLQFLYVGGEVKVEETEDG